MVLNVEFYTPSVIPVRQSVGTLLTLVYEAHIFSLSEVITAFVGQYVTCTENRP